MAPPTDLPGPITIRTSPDGERSYLRDADGRDRYECKSRDSAELLRDLINESYAAGYMSGLLDGIGAPDPAADDVEIPSDLQTEGRGATASAAFLRGVTAAARGYGREDCPYPEAGKGSQARRPWMRGFASYHEQAVKHANKLAAS